MHPEAAVIALSTDASTLEVSQKISHRHDLGADRIHPLFWNDSELAKTVDTGSKTNDPQPQILFTLALDSGDPIKCDEESTAKEIHNLYEQKKQSDDSRYKPRDWSKLGEYEKEINRMAALHFPVKVAAWNSLKLKDSEKLDLLSRAEHLRWWAQKVMDGWRKGDRDSKKSHPCLKSFDELESPYQKNDEANALFALKKKGIEVDQLT